MVMVFSPMFSPMSALAIILFHSRLEISITIASRTLPCPTMAAQTLRSVWEMAVANGVEWNVSIRLGNGTGGFTAATDVYLADFLTPAYMAIGDFNNDGNQDFAVTSGACLCAVTRLGNGSGGFTPGANASGDTYTNSLAIGDFNHDGNQDLAIANGYYADITINLGNGTGGFTTTTPTTGNLYPISPAVGDFNNDGKQDLAIANYNSNDVSIRLGEC